jgi:hypothetical protein
VPPIRQAASLFSEVDASDIPGLLAAKSEPGHKDRTHQVSFRRYQAWHASDRLKV